MYLSKFLLRLKRKLHKKAGFTFTELLAATIIMLLSTGLVVQCVEIAKEQYADRTMDSEAQLLVNSLSDAIQDYLQYASDVKLVDGTGDDKNNSATVTSFHSDRVGKTGMFQINGKKVTKGKHETEKKDEWYNNRGQIKFVDSDGTPHDLISSTSYRSDSSPNGGMVAAMMMTYYKNNEGVAEFHPTVRIYAEGSDRILAEKSFVVGKAYDVYEDVKTYTVTFDSDNGSEIISQKVIEGDKAIEPSIPTKEGFEFGDWYETKDFDTNGLKDGATPFSFDTEIHGDITLKANWTKIIEDIIPIKFVNQDDSLIRTIYEKNESYYEDETCTTIIDTETWKQEDANSQDARFSGYFIDGIWDDEHRFTDIYGAIIYPANQVSVSLTVKPVFPKGGGEYILANKTTFLVDGDGEYIFIDGDLGSLKAGEETTIPLFTASRDWITISEYTGSYDTYRYTSLADIGFLSGTGAVKNKNGEEIHVVSPGYYDDKEMSYVWHVINYGKQTSYPKSVKSFQMYVQFTGDDTKYYLYARSTGTSSSPKWSFGLIPESYIGTAEYPTPTTYWQTYCMYSDVPTWEGSSSYTRVLANFFDYSDKRATFIICQKKSTSHASEVVNMYLAGAYGYNLSAGDGTGSRLKKMFVNSGSHYNDLYFTEFRAYKLTED